MEANDRAWAIVLEDWPRRRQIVGGLLFLSAVVAVFFLFILALSTGFLGTIIDDLQTFVTQRNVFKFL